MVGWNVNMLCCIFNNVVWNGVFCWCGFWSNLLFIDVINKDKEMGVDICFIYMSLIFVIVCFRGLGCWNVIVYMYCLGFFDWMLVLGLGVDFFNSSVILVWSKFNGLVFCLIDGWYVWIGSCFRFGLWFLRV